MTVERRLSRLEAKRGGGLVREPGKTADAFTARASDGVSGAVYLPDNGRDALATGKAPAWVKSELTLRALREQHADTDYKRGRKRKAKGV